MKKFILIIICSMFLVNIVIFGIYYIDKKSNVEEIGEFYISNKFSQISGEKQEGNLLFNLKENVVTCESENNVETNETIEENKKQVTNNVPVNKTSNNVTNYKVSYEKYNSKYSFFSNDENISAENMKLAESEIDKLPQKVINAFSKYNWEICITNDNISDKYFNGSYGYVNAVTATAYRKIIVYNRSNSIKTSVVHEYGHFLDWCYDFPSLSDEFKEIYNSEVNTFKSKIPNSSCVSNEMEFFAHTFYYLIKDVSKCTPRALEFVNRYVN